MPTVGLRTGSKRGNSTRNKNVAAGTVAYTDFQGCWVQAKKVATDLGKQTWEIHHMDTGTGGAVHAGHVPF